MSVTDIRIDKFKLKSNASFTIREGWLRKDHLAMLEGAS